MYKILFINGIHCCAIYRHSKCLSLKFYFIRYLLDIYVSYDLWTYNIWYHFFYFITRNIPIYCSKNWVTCISENAILEWIYQFSRKRKNIFSYDSTSQKSIKIYSAKTKSNPCEPITTYPTHCTRNKATGKTMATNCDIFIYWKLNVWHVSDTESLFSFIEILSKVVRNRYSIAVELVAEKFAVLGHYFSLSFSSF